jgi:hypothetical protein
MNKEEALTAMREGRKVSHEYFSYEEWLTIINGKLVTHEGEACSIEDFFKTRTGEIWETGYMIVDRKKL